MKRQETIAKNLAGANIPGYKREYVVSEEFRKNLRQSLDNNSRDEDLELSQGVDKPSVNVDFSQGTLKQTGRTLDFAIQGDGFFEVTGGDGEKMYTRNGAFMVSKDNKLITAEGYTVAGQGGDIQFTSTDPLNRMSVTGDGMIKIRQGRDADNVMKEAGQLNIVGVSDKARLERISGNYFTLREEDARLAEPLEKDAYSVMNGYLENANGAPIRDMVSMIECQREFEMGQKILKMLDDRFAKELRYISS
jgi:flagellar basal-body rod protein FlgG